MTRVLTGFIWDGKSGGIDVCLMAFARIAACKDVKVDFLTNQHSPILAEELETMGHRLFEIATLHDRSSQKKTIAKLCAENQYDAAYYNISTTLMCPIVGDTRKAGVRNVIVHAHAAGNDQSNALRRLVFDAINGLLRAPLRFSTTNMLACSKEAGCWLFGKKAVAAGKVRVVPNPVDVRKCAFDEETRVTKRSELGVSGKLVVGSVTAMKEIKNPKLLIDAFAALHERVPNSVLLIVGGGELMPEIKSRAEMSLPVGSYEFLGLRDDVHDLLQAFDVFVLTSRREGLSIATIEAQAAGLPCVVSQGVPEEAILISDLGTRVPATASAEEWATEIMSSVATLGEERGLRVSYANEIEAAGYSLRSPEVVVDMVKSAVH